MDSTTERIVKAGLARLEALETEEIKIAGEIKVLIRSIQESCSHPEEMLVEGEHNSPTWSDYVDPPFRVCRFCGYSEPGWNCGYFLLAPDNCHIPRMSREEAWKFVKGGLMTQEHKNKLFHARWNKETERRKQDALLEAPICPDGSEEPLPGAPEHSTPQG